MNKIEAIIRLEKLTGVVGALADAGFPGINIVHVTGRGGETGVRSGDRGTASYVVDMLPRVKLELVVSDEDTQMAVETIMATARTGCIGDGKIFITPVTTAIRVRTGEQGDQALQVAPEKSPTALEEPDARPAVSVR